MTKPENQTIVLSTEVPGKGVPACLRGGEHIYEGDGGICILCGENPLAAMGWTRLRVTTCSNSACGATLSAIAITCPHCKNKQRQTNIARITNIYLFFVEPVRVFLFAPRPSGINFFEQVVLLLVTIIGVFLGKYARIPESSQLEIGSADLAISLVVALAVIPAVIKEKSFLDPKTPFINRIGLALQKGLAADVIVKWL